MATPPLPPLSPTVATPLAHRKRRHSEMAREGVPLAGKDLDVGKERLSTNAEEASGMVEEEEEGDRDVVGDAIQSNASYSNPSDSEEEHELIRDVVDSAELEPWERDDLDEDMELDPDEVSKIHTRLFEIGPDRFLPEMLSEMNPLLLGTAFGLNPQLEARFGNRMFLGFLVSAIVRFYHKRQKLAQYNTMDDVAQLLQQSNNIMVITGAGISTSLGIPDFRSKNTGFYTKLINAGIYEPEEVFDIEQFDDNPSVFYKLAHGILPDETRYSPTHAFIRLLQDKGKLQTNYTQNIDNLEERAGIDPTRLIQCHGSFATASCRKCKHQVKGSEIFPYIRVQQVAICKQCTAALAAQAAAAPPQKKKKKAKHNFDTDSDENSEDDNIPTAGVMKPDITFFGEQLSNTFFDRLAETDAKSVDLVLVIGTSLKVAPVSEIPNYLPHHVPHVYISREPIEHVNFDVQLLGQCDEVVWELCRRAGWELRHEMIPEGFGVVVQEAGMEKGRGCRWVVGARKGESSVDEAEKLEEKAEKIEEEAEKIVMGKVPWANGDSIA